MAQVQHSEDLHTGTSSSLSRPTSIVSRGQTLKEGRRLTFPLLMNIYSSGWHRAWISARGERKKKRKKYIYSYTPFRHKTTNVTKFRDLFDKHKMIRRIFVSRCASLLAIFHAKMFPFYVQKRQKRFFEHLEVIEGSLRTIIDLASTFRQGRAKLKI